MNLDLAIAQPAKMPGNAVPARENHVADEGGASFKDELGRQADQQPRSREASEVKISSKGKSRVAPMKSEKVKDVKEVNNQAQDSLAVAAPPMAPSERVAKEDAPTTEVLETSESALDVQEKNTVLKFMDSIESELGVPREKFVGAMVAVSSQNPQQPASQTVDQVIDTLDLSDQQAGQARKMYSEVLEQVATADSVPEEGETAAVVEESSEGTIALAANEKWQRPKGKPSLDLEKVNTKFFLREGIPQGQFRRPNMEIQGNDQVAEMPFAEGETPIIQQMKLETAGQRPTFESMPAYTYTEVAKETSSSQGAESMSETMTWGGADEDATSTGLESTESLVMAQDSQDGSEEGGQDFYNGSQDQEFQDDFAENKLGERPMMAMKSQSVAKPTSLSNSVPGQKVDINDVGQFVDRAQMLANRGGGEMKIQLNPEGLGQMDLKVAVNRGEVNVEMVAETNEAQKLLEKSIVDLKESLAGQKLKVDSIKIDLAENVSKEHFQNKQNEAEQQMARDTARGFLENFRNSNHFGRDEMLGQRGFKNYGQATAAPSLLPQDEQAQTNEVYGSRGKGRSINLVA